MPGQETEGAATWRDPWAADLARRRDAHKAQLATEHPDWTPRQIDNEGKRRVEQEFPDWNMPFQDLYLAEWQGHHIHPYNWSGPHEASNIQFLRTTEHTPFNTWFKQMAKEIREYADGTRT